VIIDCFIEIVCYFIVISVKCGLSSESVIVGVIKLLIAGII